MKKKNPNIKVTMGNYKIYWVKLFAEPTLVVLKMVNVQSTETK